MIRRLAYLAVLLLLLAATAEGLARATLTEADLAPNGFGALFEDHPTLLWRKRPNTTLTLGGVTFRTNEWGMRSPPVASPKPAGVTRVLLLGESTTEGSSMRDDETYAARLQARLDARATSGGGRYEVVNAGTGGWTIWQSMVLLDEWGEALAPDVVVPYHQANDFLPTGVRDPGNYLYAVGASDRELYERRVAMRPLLELLLRSYAWRALRREVLFRAPTLPLLGPDRGGPGVAGAGGFPPRVPRSDRVTAWTRLADWCDLHHARLVVVRPISGIYHPEDDVLPTLAARRRLAYVDLPRWLGERGVRPEDVLLDPVHPTVQGHAWIAEALEPRVVGP